MDIEQKYVITDRDDFAIFGKLTDHSTIGKVLYGQPVGAGFCTIQRDEEKVKVRCYGKSITLDLSSRREKDADIINKKLNYND